MILKKIDLSLHLKLSLIPTSVGEYVSFEIVGSGELAITQFTSVWSNGLMYGEFVAI